MFPPQLAWLMGTGSGAHGLTVLGRTSELDGGLQARVTKPLQASFTEELSSSSLPHATLYLTSQGSLTTSLYLVTTSVQRSYFSTAVMLQFAALISFNTCPINHFNNQIKTIILMS